MKLPLLFIYDYKKSQETEMKKYIKFVNKALKINVQYEYKIQVTIIDVLCLAITRRNYKYFEAILKKNPKLDINVKSMRGDTPLISAIISKDLEFLKKILTFSKLNVNIPDGTNQSPPLTFALQENNLEAFDYLFVLKLHEINPNIQNIEGNTVLMVAIEKK